MPRFRTALLAASALLLAGGNAAIAQEAAAPAKEQVAEHAGPALWKVADEDTTIYLFGTVHALPEKVDWFSGPVAEALASSQTLVTEIPAGSAESPEGQKAIISKALLPADAKLRDLLSEDQLAKYEAAMTGLGMPVAAFDRFEPWFAGMTLSVLPLMKQGFSAESGVERVIEAKMGPDARRDALETVEGQIGMLDALPQETQVEFLVATAETVDDIVPLMQQMIEEWAAGDAEGLADLMNASLTDPKLAEALLYSRNRNWADWIGKRLEEPGTVFLAVGAGHLAGEKSVQDYLRQRDIDVTRVQ